jgi:3-deoxy-manno-octulosonate cytidylyltransferase (CMP-KDO synthetase)
MKSVIGIIPARWSSSRFPGKILTPLCGKPLIQWVWERASSASSLARVVVATDDKRIAEAVRAFGGAVVMTRADHPSGTDRIAEAAQSMDADAIVNVQGDEPLIDPALIDELASYMTGDDAWDMATAAVPIRDDQDVMNPSVVKVVWNREGQALYFSRSAIPYDRDKSGDLRQASLYWRHIGIYAYQRSFLTRLVEEPPSDLEQTEKLEQLRALHIGGRIKVLTTRVAGIGVDEPEDVPKAEQALRRAGLAV